MKNLLFTVILWIGTALLLQAQNTGVLAVARPTTPTVGDTVSAGTQISLDTTVTSFVVSMLYHGQFVEIHRNCNWYMLPEDVKSGTKVFCGQIIAEPRPGVKEKLPVRTFYVR
jgi:hypothetical protein